ncbi:MAG: beta-N-acetylhexosaminidase [Deltaproteobacteria bacterium]|nr:beta-N-acetylhexosaminidase [Deltaproteobacteria bacterium]
MTTLGIRRSCGQLFSLGFEGTAAPAALLARIRAGEVGAVMLFRPNVETPAQVAGLVGRLREAAHADAPLVVSVDQEGGRVQRLRSPLTEWPPMGIVGLEPDLQRIETAGAFLGAELAALGIGWNLAPVLDVHTNPANPVIGDRAFATTAEGVARAAIAFWKGLRKAGVAGCGKHFPGHGDTHLDSHHDLPIVEHDEARLRAVELAPFVAAVAAGFPALMTAHVVYPAWDKDVPATLSKRIATDLLRHELGFKGLLVSDDLQMKAVADRYSTRDLIIESLLAGVDHFLIRGPEDRQREAYEALVTAAEGNAAVAARVNEAAARVAAFKQTIQVGLPLPGAMLPSVLGTPAHKALAGHFRKLADAPS